MVTQKEIEERYYKDNNSYPTWLNKKWREMTGEERTEYSKYRARILKIAPNPKDKMPGYYSEVEQKVPTDDLMRLVRYQVLDEDIQESLREQFLKEVEENNKKELIAIKIKEYCEKYNIDNQDKLNYAIEHDISLSDFLKENNVIDVYYTGRELKELEEKRKEFDDKVKKEVEKKPKWFNKSKKVKVKKNDKNKTSNIFEKAKIDNDFETVKNKKLEDKGYIKCLYLRKNGRAELRYVKMDEVGQIKIDSYVYHEKDAPYRYGKKNEPLLIIIEGSLIPIHKEILKENLGTESAEAQRLVIKGIEEAEVVKLNESLNDDKLKKAPNKWAILIGIGIVVALYLFLSKGA